MITTPPPPGQRSEILDVLRGIALLGICIANYPMFSLYVFQSPQTIAAMPTAKIDLVLTYFHFVFIDGKFYTLFSLLFGIGFSIMMSRWQSENKNAIAIFYRRLLILAGIGLA